MLPVVALVGRPNVGKSTLFNRLTKSRDALVHDQPGVTRDRQYGEGCLGEKPFIVIDTGGVGEHDGQIDQKMLAQSWQAALEADVVLLLVDGRAGMTSVDEEIAQNLREIHKKVYLVVNKTDGIDAMAASAEFYALGYPDVYTIAASHGRGVLSLIESTLESFDLDFFKEIEEEKALGVKVALVGRPNVGKSTLTNRLLGEERVVAFDEPGTTRDSIFIPMQKNGKEYTLIDTAGVRRRKNVKDVVEKFSIIKTLQAIEAAHVVVMMFDAQAGIVDQDLSLLGFAVDAGKSIVIAVNKWDGLESQVREYIKTELSRKLTFTDYVRIHFISALHGTAVGDLFASVDEAYDSATRILSANQLTQILQKSTQMHAPPLVKGRRIKLRFAHCGGHNPPVIVIHGNQTTSLPEAYRRYLVHQFRKEIKLMGTPIRLEFKTGENPFAGKKNELTERQVNRKRRYMKIVKKKYGK
ncbi:ribosome biogenesis GTPase Der [Piscirickettsia salmonis]|uniref:GTPase Der n=1 Tax=Piscirickettsia salmonis TaxID=1238 RepID=A0A9Q5VED7_PISSA|nr:ribosome biogenesis GTPase Der [Piscirickettsia salmonis]ALA24493.1 ribosome-associated GTPase EngA [Piscirickettsia salmonis]APS44848.1 ribosome biogenesis GTPase Der [Piscirickettsia salmonis]APS48209.1 ribosome biogenesis GTPase Der [Piscirickettsia salmonis]APS52654.1 ribosome biogenesis GTPase Der [Piscirickettsia salmonis]APS56530.1 ribosome biogenesis GTPase Der [Piscirickettsia salmonis]